ncbi:hypothetical protein N7448_003467 [Penicillium atrosanguineum]|uniref:Pre-rRNA-processing protein ESF2 n=1 Tax=Penicillium atrosanguineum TaxID=1132637 RepID=A0A9W9H984_9EURO|nr:peroxisome assembly protein [Penicillium atrosanguineum]KAJ5122335.1 hypothetical protein N7526_009272 [Penicillium atrosanguineum]KAJ5140059.1 hypothetical protein N7448_003467 [Penicillium atrosanguineum]KAJ5309973.1 peroxisome assembly protein [Penicillium atrosanguineum]KAJ5315492.1 hypothetical protein N7476_005799 [Penicillium atrosanguineum]
MTTRKHNEFLDIAPSDDESASDRGYDSEENVAKSKGRAVKRRRTTNTQDFFGVESDNDESADDDNEEEEDRAEVKGKKSKQSKATQPASNDEDENEDEDGGALLDPTKPSKPVKVLSTKPLKESKKNKTGVVYLSSLPPYLKPFALKNMIEKRNLGPVTKVFLSPRMPNNSGSTRRSNSRQLYNDGWLEFQSKKSAKICAETLNAHIVGGRKGGWYHDDVWNMKYLKGFKWADLMEQVQRERSEREARQRIEDARAKKEEKVFMSGVEAGRIADGMARKNEEKRKRQLAEADRAGTEDAKAKKASEKPAPVRRRFVQNDVVKRKDEKGVTDDADTRRVLGKIF